jgi:hypothetical protein
MFNYLKTYYYKYLFWKGEWQVSTPKKRARDLAKKGIKFDNITPIHLEDIYSKLNIWKGSSNNESRLKIAQILDDSINDVEFVPDDIFGVIVETRSHKDLEFVIHNFIENTGIKVQLFHGTDNLSFILSTNIKELVDKNMVTLTMLSCSVLTENYYNSLFLNVKFWKIIKGRKKIFVFQTDSLVCSGSDFKITDFLHFDYIGPQWHDRLRPNGVVLDGGVGGFSLRDYEKSVDSLLRFPEESWTGGEDNYFAFHIELIGGKVGSKKDSAMFCTQNNFIERSFGAHQLTNLNEVDKLKFLQYSSESKFLM